MEDNDDDIYLAPDLADSGSGASKSLISFVEWLTSSHSPASDFDYVLVTDDQSYVALDKLLPQLHKYLPTAQYEGKSNQDITTTNNSMFTPLYLDSILTKSKSNLKQIS